jgi:adenine-specific DNA methylase
VSDDAKAKLYKMALATYPNYEAKAALCKRPEEVDQEWLYAPVWEAVNRHYAHLGINAHSHQELVEQLGMLRYGHRPKVGDTFSGGGSIPFEAARLGCDVYASDLNPIACMLTWGALNIIGASPEKRAEIEKAQREVAAAVDKEITDLGIEHDEHGNRAKIYFYCLEVCCPETGWMIPMSSNWVISKQRNVIARLNPDHANKRFDIEIITGVSNKEMEVASKGTIQDGELIYELDGKIHKSPIRTLRGDYRNAEGNTQNKLRKWEKSEFKPRPDDIFQERLYAIQWFSQSTADELRKETFFASVTDADLKREQKVETIVANNFLNWQENGLIPDMEIEPGDKTNEPIRTRGWTYWHHLFTPRDLFFFQLWKNFNKPTNSIEVARLIDRTSKLCGWVTTKNREAPSNVFANQALNTLYDYCNYSGSELIRLSEETLRFSDSIITNTIIDPNEASSIGMQCDLFVTDPPYAHLLIHNSRHP